MSHDPKRNPAYCWQTPNERYERLKVIVNCLMSCFKKQVVETEYGGIEPGSVYVVREKGMTICCGWEVSLRSELYLTRALRTSTTNYSLWNIEY